MSLKTYRKNKETVWMTLGNKCARCGCKHNLQLDHIDPQTKKFDVTPKLGNKLGPLWEEIHKCQLLCPHCHREKTKGDQKVIQLKRQEFMHVDHRFDPILQENMIDITIDQNKRDGKAYIKYVNHIAEKKGLGFWDVVLKHENQFEKYYKFVYLKEWDRTEIILYEGGVSMKEIKEFKNNLEKIIEKMKKETPQLYEFYEGMYLNKDEDFKTSFTKMIDKIIDKDLGTDVIDLEYIHK